MADKVWRTCFITCLFWMLVKGEQIENVQNVLDNVFKAPKYNKMIRGVKDQTKAVDVNVTFSILSIDNLNEVDETLEIMGVLYVRWGDERLVWDPANYNNTKMVHVYQDDIWKPEIVLANSAQEITLLGHERITTSHFFNGTAHWSVGGMFKFHCSLDVTAYPWDIQICTVNLIVWGYLSHEVTLSATSDSMSRQFFHGNGAWELKSIKTEIWQESAIPSVSFAFNLRRYSLFYVVNVFIPILTLTFLNILAYFIPTASGEKLSFCITVLLALAVFLSIVGEHLPRNSKNMASLCYFLMAILIISTMICASSVLSVSLYHRSEVSIPPRWLRILLHKRVSSQNRKVAKRGNENTDTETEFHNVGFKAFKDQEKNLVDGFIGNNDTVTWQDVSIFVNKLSFWVTVVCMSISVSLFIYFVLSR